MFKDFAGPGKMETIFNDSQQRVATLQNESYTTGEQASYASASLPGPGRFLSLQ